MKKNVLFCQRKKVLLSFFEDERIDPFGQPYTVHITDNWLERYLQLYIDDGDVLLPENNTLIEDIERFIQYAVIEYPCSRWTTYRQYGYDAMRHPALREAWDMIMQAFPIYNIMWFDTFTRDRQEELIEEMRCSSRNMYCELLSKNHLSDFVRMKSDIVLLLDAYPQWRDRALCLSMMELSHVHVVDPGDWWRCRELSPHYDEIPLL